MSGAQPPKSAPAQPRQRALQRPADQGHKGAGHLKGEAEDQQHHQQKQWDAQPGVQRHAIQAVGQGAPGRGAGHREGGEVVRAGVARLGDLDEGVEVGPGEFSGARVRPRNQVRVPGRQQPRAQGGVAFQQRERQVAPSSGRKGAQRGHGRLQILGGRLNFGRVLDLLARDSAAERGLVEHRAHVLALRRDHRHDRHAQEALQRARLDLQPPGLRLVHQIQGDHHRHLEFHQLQREVEVALQVTRVEDVQNHVRRLVQQGGAGDDLLGRMWAQRVGPRQVQQMNALPGVREVRLALFDRDARPVAHPQLGARQGVDQGGLADVGVARHQDRQGARGLDALGRVLARGVYRRRARERRGHSLTHTPRSSRGPEREVRPAEGQLGGGRPGARAAPPARGRRAQSRVPRDGGARGEPCL